MVCLPHQTAGSGMSRFQMSTEGNYMKAAIGAALLFVLAASPAYTQEPDKDKAKEKPRPAQQEEPKKREPENRPPQSQEKAREQQSREQDKQQRDAVREQQRNTEQQ